MPEQFPISEENKQPELIEVPAEFRTQESVVAQPIVPELIAFPEEFLPKTEAQTVIDHIPGRPNPEEVESDTDTVRGVIKPGDPRYADMLAKHEYNQSLLTVASEAVSKMYGPKH